MMRPRRGGDEDEWVMDGRADPEGDDGDGRGTEHTAYVLDTDDAGDDSDDGGGGGGGGNLGTCEEAGDSS